MGFIITSSILRSAIVQTHFLFLLQFKNFEGMHIAQSSKYTAGRQEGKNSSHIEKPSNNSDGSKPNQEANKPTKTP